MIYFYEKLINYAQLYWYDNIDISFVFKSHEILTKSYISLFLYILWLFLLYRFIFYGYRLLFSLNFYPFQPDLCLIKSYFISCFIQLSLLRLLAAILAFWTINNFHTTILLSLLLLPFDNRYSIWHYSALIFLIFDWFLWSLWFWMIFYNFTLNRKIICTHHVRLKA